MIIVVHYLLYTYIWISWLRIIWIIMFWRRSNANQHLILITYGCLTSGFINFRLLNLSKLSLNWRCAICCWSCCFSRECSLLIFRNLLYLMFTKSLISLIRIVTTSTSYDPSTSTSYDSSTSTSYDTSTSTSNDTSSSATPPTYSTSTTSTWIYLLVHGNFNLLVIKKIKYVEF